jgi:hypothetical protein
VKGLLRQKLDESIQEALLCHQGAGLVGPFVAHLNSPKLTIGLFFLKYSFQALF